MIGFLFGLGLGLFVKVWISLFKLLFIDSIEKETSNLTLKKDELKKQLNIKKLKSEIKNLEKKVKEQ